MTWILIYVCAFAVGAIISRSLTLWRRDRRRADSLAERMMIHEKVIEHLQRELYMVQHPMPTLEPDEPDPNRDSHRAYSTEGVAE